MPNEPDWKREYGEVTVDEVNGVKWINIGPCLDIDSEAESAHECQQYALAELDEHDVDGCNDPDCMACNGLEETNDA
jgi:hypothetical protein